MAGRNRNPPRRACARRDRGDSREETGRPRARAPASAGRSTLAVRIPQHRRLRDLLSRLGSSLTATSANLSGQPPILRPDDLSILLEDFDAVLIDDGVLPGGPPSTLVEISRGRVAVLREGSFARQRIEQLVQRKGQNAIVMGSRP